MGPRKTDKKDLALFFLRKKPTDMLLQLKRKQDLIYASVLAKEVDCTYSHTVRILQELEERGLIEFKKKGRLKLIQLTKTGSDIAGNLAKLTTLFSKADK